MKALFSIQLYVTGTCMQNRISKEIRIPKNTREFKTVQQGNNKNHCYSFKVREVVKSVSIDCWKDCNMVYCLTNIINTNGKDTCFHQSKNNIITIDSPKVIEQHNRHVGGVNLADMKRLHCNCTIIN